ncbi:hypothetical protein [Rhodoligotrophos defluvii]|uniref:hypothetical protein n=1 Tax=Rhodoligotrophos defluvii TaxID=2561934 RepID=UPI0010C9D254|nr:hypothetical protein [Rhodoligotrophos defluvii]
MPLELQDLPDVDAPGGDGGLRDVLSAPVGDDTAAYAIAMRQPFDQLRQAAAQVAGILALAAAGSRTASPDHPMLALARQAYEEAVDAIRSTKSPRQAAHHHRHMLRAVSFIGRALNEARATACSGGVVDVDRVLPPLRIGWQELQWTAGALPGFEVVAFNQACCAHHGRQAP